MDISIDLDKVKEFVYSSEFTKYLVDNTDDIGVSAFILQTLLERIEEIENG